MGCDIHSYAEQKNPRTGRWEKLGDIFPYEPIEREWMDPDSFDSPFIVRNYRMFGFLADVRNEADVPPISKPRGLPRDLSPEVRRLADEGEWGGPGHSHSWLSLQELSQFDYDAEFEDRRIMRQTGPDTWTLVGKAPKGQGTRLTYREILPKEYFDNPNILIGLGDGEDIRIVFWFDN